MLGLTFPVVPLAFLTAIFYLNFVSRIILGPFLPVIEHELGLGHGGAGSLFLFVQLGYAAGLLGSGVVSWRFTHRHTIVTSAVVVGIALVGLSLATSLGSMRFWLVLIGAGAGLYLPSGVATITHLVHDGQWGKGLAFHELAPNLAFITAPSAEALIATISWRGVLAVVGGVAVLLGACFARSGPGGGQRGEPPRLQTMAGLLRNPSVWAMMLIFAAGVGSSLGLYSMLPLFLVSSVGMTLRAANSITGLSRVACVGVAFFSGWLTDRMGHRHALTVALTTTASLNLCLGLSSPGPVLTPIFVFLQGAAAVMFFPPAFAAVSRLVPVQMRNLGVALTTAVGVFLGGGGVPALVGYLAEVASFSTAFTVVGALAILSPLLLRVRSVPGTNHDGDQRR